MSLVVVQGLRTLCRSGSLFSSRANAGRTLAQYSVATPLLQRPVEALLRRFSSSSKDGNGNGEEDNEVLDEDSEQSKIEGAVRKKKYILSKTKSFVDMRNVLVRGGHGGLGCFALFREPYARFRRPDGGDGGLGGDVIFQADRHIGCLSGIPVTIVGERGSNGMGNNKFGQNGKEHVVKVPVGTVIFKDSELLVDLDEDGAQFLAARGGKGGKGNANGPEAIRPESAMDDKLQGEPGEETRYRLELKSLADIGLVGLPNAGKSTFIRAVSNAHPKVADYPFTTLNPHLGVVDFPDFFRMTIADIPGLLPGAHRNVGLGHDFLKHIERSSVLMFVIDMSETNGSYHPVKALHTIQRELEAYLPGLSKRRCLIAANKMDCPLAEKNFLELVRNTNIPVVPVSAKLGVGVLGVTAKARELVEKARADKDKHKTKQSYRDMLYEQ